MLFVYFVVLQFCRYSFTFIPTRALLIKPLREAEHDKLDGADLFFFLVRL